MRKNKIIAALVAVGGIVATVTTSFALYTSIDADKTINITYGTTNNALVTYSINEIINNSTALIPNSSHSYSFGLGATYTAGTNYPAQSSAVGNITITVTVDDAAVNYLNVSDITLGGYDDGTWASNQKVSKTQEGNVYTFTLDGLAVEAGKNPVNSVSFTVGLPETVTADNMLAMNEALYSIDVSWGQVSESYGQAHIIGAFNGWNTEDKSYPMVPDLTSKPNNNNYGTVEDPDMDTGFCWRLDNLTFTEATEVKAYKDGFSAGKDNLAIAANTPTDVSWWAGRTDQALIIIKDDSTN